MSKKRYPRPHGQPDPQPSPQLTQILCDLESRDDQTRADAVRQLCPCRGAAWEIPVFERVASLRDDPSPLVRQAVRHDLEENPDWGERSEARRLRGRQRRVEMRRAKREIDDSAPVAEVPSPHSLGWRMRPRPRVGRVY